MVCAHEEDMDDVLYIVMVHPTQSPLSSQADPFASLDDEIVAPIRARVRTIL